MSYNIQLCDPVTQEVLHLDALHQMTGGTYTLNGTDKNFPLKTPVNLQW